MYLFSHLFHIGVFFIIMLSLSGCSVIWHEDNLKAHTVSLADKVVLSTSDMNSTNPRVCVEPSPDGASALSLSIAAKGGLSEEKQADLAMSMQSGDSYVGLRTHSIQLLRDMSYRTCEAYLSGAIDGEHYGMLLRRFQKQMIALMAIEQLTGVVKTPPIVVNLESSAQASNSLLALQKNINKVDEDIAKLSAEISKLDEKKEDENATINRYNEQITSYKSIKDSLTKAMDEGKVQIASGKVTSQIGSYSVPSSAIDLNASGVVGAVKEITMDLIGQDDAPFLCFDYLSRKDKKRSILLDKYCQQHLFDENGTKPIKRR